MANDVTKRFVECHNTLKNTARIKSSRQFAIAIDALPQSLNEILKGNRDATVKHLMKIVEVFNVNPSFLLTGLGDMFFVEEEVAPVISTGNIKYISAPAYAGVMDQMQEAVMEEDAVSFSIPGYQDIYGEHRCFDVAGDSMEPTLSTGDKIVCSQITLQNIRDKHVYVVVTQSDIMVKRVINNIRVDNTLQLLSDNDYYTPISLPIEEVQEVWRVNMRLSQFLSYSTTQSDLMRQIERLEMTIQAQANCIQGLEKSISNWMKTS